MSNGLYGQREGNENRQSVAVFSEHLSDNEICEGREVAKLREMFIDHDFDGIDSYHKVLLTRGFSPIRLQYMMSTASCGIKF